MFVFSPLPCICAARLTEPRLHTAVSSLDVFSRISVHRLLLWITPAWHRYVIAILTGKPRHEGLGVPEAVYTPKDIDAINAAIFQQHRSEPIEQVRSEFQLTHQMLMRLIDPMADDDLMKPYRDFLPDHPDESDAPIIDTIYGDTAFHYREHQSWIEAMLA